MSPHLLFSLVIIIINTGYTLGFLQLYNHYRSYYEKSRNRLIMPSAEIELEYDFIIIGSGSAGAVIANRLSEIPEWKILLLEAGGKPGFSNQIPISAPTYQLLGDYNWNYTMEKQDGFCLAMEDQRCAWPKGKALGGSTILNYMIYTRGHPQDYNDWGTDNPGWSYEEILPYFLKSEDCELGDNCLTRYHATHGYLSVEESYHSELTDNFIAAGQELGYNEIDYNTNSLIGFSKMQATQKFGRRHSVAAAFLDPISDRSNLKIVTKAKVTKILIGPESKMAYGIDFMKNGRQFTVNAKKEVILSAGAISSPQLLMLSGIGPINHLSQLGISPIIQDVPVGKNLYDHIAFTGMIYVINREIEPQWKLYDPVSALEWFLWGKGFWTSLGGIEAIAYISTKNQTRPDMELLLSGTGTLQFDKGLISRPELRITRAFYDEYFAPLENRAVFMIMPVLLHPKSSGWLKLRSTNPDDPPLCYGNYLTDPDREDLSLLIKSIRLTQKLIEYEGFRRLDATLYDKPVPGCENFVFDSDRYWECAIRHLSLTIHHQIATCQMGPSEENSVVDSRLKVHGVRNLRVADTSVIPLTLSAHTSAPAMMVGEKAGDIIKEEWFNKRGVDEHNNINAHLPDFN